MKGERLKEAAAVLYMLAFAVLVLSLSLVPAQAEPPCMGQLDQAEAAAQDIAEAMIWLDRGGDRPYAEDPQVMLLAQGVQRSLCFLKAEEGQ